ncbi:MAG TPA: acyl-CoA dehydrogenase family protein, partial [Tepidiformaceae bacterium]|nr:acyl-CoA dehydrogenase family protein [Tepidiformaceae bacterium]
MINEIQPVTEAGRRMVAMAEQFANQFAPAATENDRTATYPLDHLEQLKQAGYLYAPLPEDAGGMGVESVHDILLASSRLTRGDAGLTLGVNMHQIIMMTYARNYRMAAASGNEAKAAGIHRAMKRAAETGMLIGAAVSEPEQDLLRPSTTVHFDGGNWLISGRKIFSSGAPGMTHFSVSLAHVDNDGNEVMAYAVVPKDAPGVIVNNDWDAMG